MCIFLFSKDIVEEGEEESYKTPRDKDVYIDIPSRVSQTIHLPKQLLLD